MGNGLAYDVQSGNLFDARCDLFQLLRRKDRGGQVTCVHQAYEHEHHILWIGDGIRGQDQIVYATSDLFLLGVVDYRIAAVIVNPKEFLLLAAKHLFVYKALESLFFYILCSTGDLFQAPFDSEVIFFTREVLQNIVQKGITGGTGINNDQGRQIGIDMVFEGKLCPLPKISAGL